MYKYKAINSFFGTFFRFRSEKGGIYAPLIPEERVDPLILISIYITRDFLHLGTRVVPQTGTGVCVSVESAYVYAYYVVTLLTLRCF